MQKREARIAKWALFFSVSLLALVGIGSAAAQTATGTINGTVTDPQGLSMSAVTVNVKDVDTGTDHIFTSNETGLYVAPLLEPGNYEIVASKDGFNTIEQKGVTLLVAQTLTVDIKMSLKTQEGTVTVTSELPLIETEKTEQSQAITENLVAEFADQRPPLGRFRAAHPGRHHGRHLRIVVLPRYLRSVQQQFGGRSQ